MELSELKGIGEQRLKALHAAGISSLRELLCVFPVQYRDMRTPQKISEVQVGEKALLCLNRVGDAKLAFFAGKSRVTCEFQDDTGKIRGIWFNQLWMRTALNKGTRFMLYGTVTRYGNSPEKQLVSPSMETTQRIEPRYRPIEGIPQKLHESLTAQALAQVEVLFPETLPETLCRKYQLMPRAEAVRILHAPTDLPLLDQARRRWAFEQMLLYQAAVRLVRDLRRSSPSIPYNEKLSEAFWSRLPFSPTQAQKRTLTEIGRDMEKEKAMARMVQGDVGSGKTAVAMGAMLFCVQAGHQCALMVPTEILARQHFQSMKPFFEKLGYSCELLLSGLPSGERRRILKAFKTGECQVAIGTQALIGKSVVYKDLALCITDEQHRFGVAQRTALLNKAGNEKESPHLLVMSATPIPRSLALILFGDLDLSLIDELPPGRLPVTTRVVPEEKRQDMYGFIRKELEAGHQAYFVCPLVEENEKTDCLKSAKAHAAELQRGPFSSFRVGLTYGTQPSEEKTETLAAFARGDLNILVATTVIEVGINVPNATLMVIEGADRYGLAQLHQLRGRVGRGNAQSWCFLLAESNERLKTLVRTNNGFEVARADLEQRGPGELLGTRQSGTDLPDGTVLSDMQLLYEAAKCAETLYTDPRCSSEWQAVAALAREKVENMSDRISVS